MKTLENILVNNNFENSLIEKIDFEKFSNKLKSYYKIRSKHGRNINLFNRDFYIFKERTLNNRTFKDISKDVNRSLDNTRIRFLIMSYYVDLVKNQLKINN
jgi:hypothetical protein